MAAPAHLHAAAGMRTSMCRSPAHPPASPSPLPLLCSAGLQLDLCQPRRLWSRLALRPGGGRGVAAALREPAAALPRQVTLPCSGGRAAGRGGDAGGRLTDSRPCAHKPSCTLFAAPGPAAAARELFAQLVRVMRRLAAFVNCRPQELALVPNATTGRGVKGGRQVEVGEGGCRMGGSCWSFAWERAARCQSAAILGSLQPSFLACALPTCSTCPACLPAQASTP